MTWTVDNTIPEMKGKSLKLKEVFAKAANISLSKGFNEEESIFAGLSAVKIQEKKDAPPKLKPAPIPSHIKILKERIVEVEKAQDAPVQEIPYIKSVEFDDQGHLVVTMSNGQRVVSKTKAVEQHIQQSVGVSVNPVFDHVQMNTTANYTSEDYLPGMLTWNEFEDCLDIVQADGSILQVGLESYIQVVNNTGFTVENGTTVCFSGVHQNETPEVSPLIADGSIEPLYAVGVLTNTLQAGQVGRATVFGKVRNLNTTGADVGEDWQQGDLLWAHPLQAGRLTKFRPTAPDVAISIAAVLRVGEDNGILLVRPTIFPRLFYGTFSSYTDQSPLQVNTPTHVHFETTEIKSGMHVEEFGKVVTERAGLYAFDFRLQLTSTNSSQKNMYIWARKNGVDIPRSASKVTVGGNNINLVPSWSFTISMLPDDYFELMYAVDDLSVSITAPEATTFCPNTPSATLRVSQINL